MRSKQNKALKIIGPCLLFFCVLVAYSNTFRASWHFDDYHTILENPILHIESLHPSEIYRTFFAAPGGGKYSGKNLYRPVSCMSFALNWYFGKDDVTGYHVINLLVHLLTSILIYLCSVSILSSPKIKDRFGDHKYYIAILSAKIWAVHPVQTQAVTYIVQRMASLSAMFGILSLWLYVAARNKEKSSRRKLCFAGSALSCILSIGAKENGVLIPLGIILLEILFFRNLSKKQFKRLLLWGTVICLFLTVMGMFYLDSKGVLSGYDKRDYTLMQRLLTETRVLMLYISQLFLPLPGRFSIEHDIVISNSLFSPWATLPSLMAIMGLFATGLMQMQKRPLISLAILFYFINHLVESTVIPLELVFEHRNYLPTAFVFLPISQGIVYAVRYCRQKGIVLSGISVSAVPVLILFLIGSTFLRNDVWATEKRLWENAAIKAPEVARPYQNLAYHYYEMIGRYDIALGLYQKALTLRTQNPKRTRAQILTNIGVIYDKAGEYETAYDYYMKALEVSPGELMPRYNAAMAFIGMGRLEEALGMADDLISRKPGDKDSNNLKGSILLKQGHPKAAIPYLKKSLNAEPTHYKALINLGVALFQTGSYDESKQYLETALSEATHQGLPLLCLIENRLRAGDNKEADIYLQKLLYSVTLDEIHGVLRSIGKNNFLVPISKQILTPFILEKTGNREPEGKPALQKIPVKYQTRIQ